MDFSSALEQECFLNRLILRDSYSKVKRIAVAQSTSDSATIPHVSDKSESVSELPAYMVMMNLLNPPLMKSVCEEILRDRRLKKAHQLVRPYLSLVNAAGTHPMSLLDETAYNLYVVCALYPDQKDSTASGQKPFTGYVQPIKDAWSRFSEMKDRNGRPLSLVMASNFVALFQRHAFSMNDNQRELYIDLGQSYFAQNAETNCKGEQRTLNPTSAGYKTTRFIIDTLLYHIATPVKNGTKQKHARPQDVMKSFLADLNKREPERLAAYVQAVYDEGCLPIYVHNCLYKYRQQGTLHK